MRAAAIRARAARQDVDDGAAPVPARPAPETGVDVRPATITHRRSRRRRRAALGGGADEIERRRLAEPRARDVAGLVGHAGPRARAARIPARSCAARRTRRCCSRGCSRRARRGGSRSAATMVETVVYFDHGRPGVRVVERAARSDGRAAAARGQDHARRSTSAARPWSRESGRRMGEILVDFGYLKRRELLPAVRRHVEDIRLFAVRRGTRGYYRIVARRRAPSAERIRLSRHPAALILEGSSPQARPRRASSAWSVRRRRWSRCAIASGSAAISRHRATSSAEERAALAAFDGQADLAQVARTAGVDLADVLPLAWGAAACSASRPRAAPTPRSRRCDRAGRRDRPGDRSRARARALAAGHRGRLLRAARRAPRRDRRSRSGARTSRRGATSPPIASPAICAASCARELDDIAHVLDEAFRVLRDDSPARHVAFTNLSPE